MSDDQLKQIARELELIKRLLVAALAREGMTQEQLAVVLESSQPTVSRMFPGGFPKPNGEATKGNGNAQAVRATRKRTNR